MLSRRDLIKIMSVAPLLGMTGFPRLLWAAPGTEERLVVIILRGAMDGLYAVPAIGDPQFVAARGPLAGGAEGAYQLDTIFALHKDLPYFGSLYQNKQGLIFHAAALPYRQRSHFDAQNMLESGTIQAGNYESGWLNRTLAVLGASEHPLGIAISSSPQLILRGPAKITSWMPDAFHEPKDDLIRRIGRMYEGDPLLAPLVSAADTTHNGEDKIAVERGKASGQMHAIAASAARFLLEPNGPRIAVIDLGGFDSHAGQMVENGALSKALKELDATFQAFAENLAPVWRQTSILAVTEFGRTVAMNGTAGSDHGTGSAAFLAGGNVRGGRVLADWPGLGKSQLLEGRDLNPTLDLHRVFKGVLAGQFRIDPGLLDRAIFPGSNNASALTNLYNI